MKLFIDTTDREKIIIGLDNQKLETTKVGKSQALLPFIVDELTKNGRKINDISEIEVATGPGSFTGLRVGISVANTLGWALNVPVNSKKVSKDGPVNPTYS
jgi:tRNA threonylcarbamoyladenosine biosynthesis protein TsaB